MSTNSNTVDVLVYKPEYKSLWDNFVLNSKNGIFLFYRDYMEYHSNRFHDHSIMFVKGKKLVGLMPANVTDNALHSHEGLTFGGVIANCKMTTSLMLEIFRALIEHCKSQNIPRVMYKAIPYIYHVIPANEDQYALFRYNAKIIARNVSSTLPLDVSEKKFDGRRKESIRKAKKHSLTVKRSDDLESFMKLAETVLLERHGVKPVHSLNELTLLADRFPDNIKLFASYKGEKMLAGVIIYESQNVAHGQYAANSDEGRRIGAQDIIEDYLINNYYRDKRYYDFGISTEQLGQVLNPGLISRKEGFGASAVTYDIYKLTI